MVISEDSWFSGVLGRPVYTIHCDQPTELRDQISLHAAARPAATYFAKVDTADVGIVRELIGAGMYVVDVNVTYVADLSQIDPVAIANRDLAVSDFSVEQTDAVLRIASTAFQYSRFHLDPAIPPEAANRARYEWVKNYIDGKRGLRLLAATLESKVAGFLAVNAALYRDEPVWNIDLIAVDREARNRGVAERLIRHLFQISRNKAGTILVGTQVANIPSVRLYEKLGFRLVRSQYVLHMHKLS